MDDASQETRSESGGVGTDGAGDDRSVVFVSQQYPPDRSGHASRIRDTATALADEGWNVTVLAAHPSFPPGTFDRRWRPVETTTDDGVTVRRLWTWQPTDPDPGFLSRMCYYVCFALYATLWVALRRERDVVVTTTPPISTGLAGLPTAVLGGRWVVDVRDLWIDASVSLGFIAAGGVLERASRRFQRRVLKTADAVAVTTATLRESLCEQYGEELWTKTMLVPNGVDVSGFVSRSDDGDTSHATPASADAETDGGDGRGGGTNETESREGNPGAPDPFVVVYTGNIGHAQDLEACVRALEHLPERVVLRLVGGGDAVPRLRRFAADRGVGHRVEFEGTVPHDRVPELLSDADVGIAPLKDDPELAYAMPTKVYEYLCARLPVVSTGRGELERFLEESGGGVHASNDPESIAEAIAGLADDAERRVALGERGHEHVREHCDRTVIANRFSERLHRLVEDGARDVGR